MLIFPHSHQIFRTKSKIWRHFCSLHFLFVKNVKFLMKSILLRCLKSSQCKGWLHSTCCGVTRSILNFLFFSLIFLHKKNIWKGPIKRISYEVKLSLHPLNHRVQTLPKMLNYSKNCISCHRFSICMRFWSIFTELSFDLLS